MTCVLSMLSVLFFVLGIFMPSIIPDGSGTAYVITSPIQSKTVETDALDAPEIAIYAMYIAGVMIMGGFANRNSGNKFVITGLLLVLASWLAGIWRMYQAFGCFPGFATRVGMTMYLGGIASLLLVIDAAVGHRIYPVNVCILLGFPAICLSALPAAVISKLVEGGGITRISLMQFPMFIHEIFFCAALACGIVSQKAK